MTSRPFKNVIVAGANGTIGAPIVSCLINNGNFNVFALSRPESQATFPIGVAVKRADLASYSQLVEVLRGQDVFICTLNDAAAELQPIIIEAAYEAGVRRFLQNEWASHELTVEDTPLEEARNGKKAIIDLLQSKSRLAEAAGKEFHWTGINNGAFFDWSLRTAFLDISLSPTRTATIWNSGSDVTTLTNLSTVAKSVLAVLTTAESRTRNRLLNIESFAASQNDIVNSLEQATGEKWSISRTTTADQLASARGFLESGDFPSALYIWIRAFMFSSNSKLPNIDNELLGLPREDLQTSVDNVIKGGLFQELE